MDSLPKTPGPIPSRSVDSEHISLAELKQELLRRTITAASLLSPRHGVDASPEAIARSLEAGSPFDGAVRSLLEAAGSIGRPFGPTPEELRRRIDELFMAMTMADIRRLLSSEAPDPVDEAAPRAPSLAEPTSGECSPDARIADPSVATPSGPPEPPPPPDPQSGPERGVRDWAMVPEMSRLFPPGEVFDRFIEPSSDPAHAVGQPIDFVPDQEFMQLVESLREATADELRRAIQPTQKPGWLQTMRRLTRLERRDDAIDWSAPPSAGALDSHQDGDLIARAGIEADAPLLVVGDIHGDSWSLAAALALADHPDWLYDRGILALPKRELTVLLLGDLVDRGPDSALCALMTLRRFRDRPLKSLMVAGNHDVSYSCIDAPKRFSATVEPCEFGDWLNSADALDGEGRVRLGRQFVEFIKRLPRAIVTPSGLLAVHAGVPHVDLLPALTDLATLQASEQARDDFTWLRLAERASKKIPNRSSRGCEIGTHQWAASIAHLSSIIGHAGWPRIRCAVRGHDHHAERFHIHQGGFPPMTMLTLNSMGDTVDDPMRLGNELRLGCVAVYDGRRTPRLVRIAMPPDRERLHFVPGEAAPDSSSGVANRAPMPASVEPSDARSVEQQPD